MFNHVEKDFTLPTITRETTESGRRYFTPEGKVYPSVTTVLSIVGKDKLDAWKKRVGTEEANRISKKATNRGTIIHSLAENYLNNEPHYAKGVMPVDVFTFSSIKKILDSSVDNVYLQEEFLYSDKLKCAGQVDCIAEYDGILSIIDFKTSLKPKKKEWITNYFMQTAFYASAFYEHTNIPIKQGVIIISVDDDQPQVFKVNTFDYLKEFISVRYEYTRIHGY